MPKVLPKVLQLRPFLALIFIITAMLLLAGCQSALLDDLDPMKIANPASIFCNDQGGSLKVELRGDIGEYGVCVFEDNRQCEEWAMYRNKCPIGGIDVSDSHTPASAFCALTGGIYSATSNQDTADEQGTCTFPDESQCDAWAYYNGDCQAGK